MDIAFRLFAKNIQRARDLHALIEEIEAHKEAIRHELLRSELVLIVAALDKLVHDIVRLGIVEILENQRLPTDAYEKNVTIPLTTALSLVEMERAEMTKLIDSYIYGRFQEHSYQKADKISGGLAFISSINKKFEKFYAQFPPTLKTKLNFSEAKSITIYLDNIVGRRNMIAHECDTPYGLEEPEELTPEDLKDYTDFIEALGLAFKHVL